MLYEDSHYAPATADAYERAAHAAAPFTADDARAILRAHGVRGRSKLTADEAKAMVREQWPDELVAAKAAKTVRYRWQVAHGLRVTYAELAEIEKRAGVEPLPGPGARGAYASADDVARVYEVGAEYRAGVHSVRVRVTADDAEDEEAAAAVLAALRASFECTDAEVYGRRGGGRAWYFEVAVPKQ